MECFARLQLGGRPLAAILGGAVAQGGVLAEIIVDGFSVLLAKERLSVSKETVQFLASMRQEGGKDELEIINALHGGVDRG